MTQDGSLFAIGDTCYLKFYHVVDGRRVHKTIQLCKRDDVHDWSRKNRNGRTRWSFSSAVRDRQRQEIERIKSEQRAEEAKTTSSGDMRVADFWETEFLPYCETVREVTGEPRMKPSTVRGFKQIWNQHLKSHFGETTLRQYEPATGTRFLRTLVDTQCKTTLKHIKALGTAIFKCAVNKDRLKVNPWHDVLIPDDAVAPTATEHYTLAEAENLISSLVDHVDCQLVMALACFLGLRPNEIAALKWDDFDSDYVHIRRGVVRGVVGTPKTPESLASLPLIPQVKLFVNLWHQKSGKPTEGWVFPSENNTPLDLHNLIARVIRPHVEGETRCVRCKVTPAGSGVTWKALYAGRRGAGTAVVEATNGNLAVAQALLRHKNQMTTATFYKKAVSSQALLGGMKALASAIKANGKKVPKRAKQVSQGQPKKRA